MKKKALYSLLFLTFLSLFITLSKTAWANSDIPMYRLYNPNSGEHFYTASQGERAHLARVGWTYEGIAWNAPSSGEPVYRLYNPNAGDHHYTPAAGERDFLIKVGWRYEGVSWYSSGSAPLYRLYNPNAVAGAHHYTLSKAENDYLVRVGWRAEGIGWYGNPSTSLKTTITRTDGITYANGILIANKQNSLPSNYNPGENPTAGQAFQALKQKMQSLGYSVSNSYSGFRSYSYQSSLYNSYVASHGRASADRFSARPGYSEHQTGLAFDLINGSGQLLGSTAADSGAAQWLSQHAHEYGFIVRYPPNKERVTGYMPEPWHIRYIGNEATAIYNSGLTLEEYLGVTGGTTYK